MCLQATRSAVTCKRTRLPLAWRSSHPHRRPSRFRSGRDSQLAGDRARTSRPPGSGSRTRQRRGSALAERQICAVPTTGRGRPKPGGSPRGPRHREWDGGRESGCPTSCLGMTVVRDRHDAGRPDCCFRPNSAVRLPLTAPSARRSHSRRAIVPTAARRRCLCHGCDGRLEHVAVTVGDPRIVGSVQPTGADRRLPARGVAPPRRTPESRTAGDADLELLLLAVVELVPDDDVGLRDGRERCASRATRGCRRTREKSLRAACLRILAEEPDVDPARVPEATRAPIGGHRRRGGNRLDGVGDQPSRRR